MSEDLEEHKENEDGRVPADDGETTLHSDYKPTDAGNAQVKHQLSGMYQNWFLDYASYVILERAVPHIVDGLKPVQRRILHSMRRMEDGRYNKVANIVGHTMQFHPHGDASIGDALVQLGQKELLIDCQGNWGNILTGDSAAAPRYIEARLSKLALDVVFNPKTTEWKLSYDGRNKEPVTLPVKFPLLLAQGVEGIAVGLSSKILPHNFNELCHPCSGEKMATTFSPFSSSTSSRCLSPIIPVWLERMAMRLPRRMGKYSEVCSSPGITRFSCAASVRHRKAPRSHKKRFFIVVAVLCFS